MALAQLDQRLGDLAGNARAILGAIDEGRRAGASLVVTPELSLCGYPPEDLVLRPAFLDACASELAALAAQVNGVTALVGFPERSGGARHNAIAVLRDGRVSDVYRKQRLPNYTVFDEQRYFAPGAGPCVFDVAGVRCGVVICEDCWFDVPARQARASSSCRTDHRTTRGSRRRGARRSRRACAKPACRSSTSIASAARTSSCSTARRS
jgi:predicted amidohydrolase